MGFLEQFLEIFSELKGKDFYVSGESVSTICLYAPLALNLTSLNSLDSMLAFVSDFTIEYDSSLGTQFTMR